MDELERSTARPDIGLHVTLTWGKPLLPPIDVPSLVDENGNFLSKGGLFIKALRRKLDGEDVYKEAKAQCEKLLSRGIPVSHLDGHHHVHIFPIVRDAVARVAKEYEIKRIRAPHEGFWTRSWDAFARRFAVALIRSSRPSYWRKRGFETNDRFGGFALGAGEGLAGRWRMITARLKKGSTEIMVHPGYASDGGDSYSAGREEELKLLTDPEFAHELDKMNIGYSNRGMPL
jgi:predicted glycoside hydrolase/deacetylase ChbG (UPF0249 family)